jgi:hypothetical protein
MDYHIFAICVCNTQTQMRYGNTPLRNQTSIFIDIAEQNNGLNQRKPSILCYLDSTGKNGNQDFVTNISHKIRLFLNVMWQSKFGAKVVLIQNPFSKRSLPLWCPKGEYYL